MENNKDKTVGRRPKRKKGGCLKWLILIGGAIFILGFCGAMALDPGEEPDTEETTEGVEEQTEEDTLDNPVQEATTKNEESSSPTQEELNEKLKAEAVQVEFVKANAGEYNEGDKLFVKGEVDVFKDDSVLVKSLMSAEEGEGYGVYDVEGFNITDTEFSEGDTVTVYGSYKGESESGLPLIIATIIEK